METEDTLQSNHYERKDLVVTAERGKCTRKSVGVKANSREQPRSRLCQRANAKELSGFVIFDEQNHYRVDLPEGWKNWDGVKPDTTSPTPKN